MEEEWVVEEAEVVEAKETAMEAAKAEVVEAGTAASTSAPPPPPPPPPPPNGKACTCWVATNGADANNTIAAAIAAILKVIRILELHTLRN